MTTQPQGMSASERVHAAIKGQPVDRVPFVFWHHFKPQGSGKRMAELTLEFFIDKFQLDIVKIMPDLSYPAPAQPITQTAHMARFAALERRYNGELSAATALHSRHSRPAGQRLPTDPDLI